MNITATLFVQMFTFAVFVWFTMRFVWKPLTRIMEERNKRIADGLAAAERGQRAQQLAQKGATDTLYEAKQQGAEILNQAQKRAAQIIDEAKTDARAEGERLIVSAKAEIEQATNRAKEQLRQQVAALAIAGAEKVLQREIDKQAHSEMLDELVAQI